jgi:hypothetical protein
MPTPKRLRKQLIMIVLVVAAIAALASTEDGRRSGLLGRAAAHRRSVRRRRLFAEIKEVETDQGKRGTVETSTGEVQPW